MNIVACFKQGWYQSPTVSLYYNISSVATSVAVFNFTEPAQLGQIDTPQQNIQLSLGISAAAPDTLLNCDTTAGGTIWIAASASPALFPADSGMLV